MDEGKTELSLRERAELLKSRVSFHNKKASWKRSYREKFNVMVKEHTVKVEHLKAKRNEWNAKAKELKISRDECTDYYRKAKVGNNIVVMNSMLKEQDNLHNACLLPGADPSVGSADVAYQCNIHIYTQVKCVMQGIKARSWAKMSFL